MLLLITQNAHELLDYSVYTEEKGRIFNIYYSFIHNKSCLNFIQEVVILLDKHQICIDKKDQIHLAIIILKSFLMKKTLRNISESHYDSDDIFNFIVQQYNFYLISVKKKIPLKKIQTLALHSLDVLVWENLLEQTIRSMQEGGIKTRKYYAILNINYEKKLFEYVEYSGDKYTFFEFDGVCYVTTHHYSMTIELFKANIFSNIRFKLKKVSYILNKINTPLYVDKKCQQIFKKRMNLDVTKTIEQIKINTQEINSLFTFKNWTPDYKEKIALLQSENSKMLKYLIYNQFCNINFKKPIYLPISSDFRSRQYYPSTIGPTFSKLLRFCFYYGYYDRAEFKEEDIKFCKNYIKYIKIFCKKFNILDEKRYYESYFWVLISIGKFFIDKNTVPVSVEDFLTAAIENYDRDLTDMDDESFAALSHYKLIIRDLNNAKILKIKKRILAKDATASINQVFIKELDPLNQDSMNYVNLGISWMWFDMYKISAELFYNQIINIKKFKKYHDKKLFEEVMHRGLIKTFVMTIPYSAGFAICWEKYLEAIKEKNKNIIIDDELKKLMYAFFKFIKKDIQKLYLYKKESSSLIDEMVKNFEQYRTALLKSDTGIADISYFIMKKSTIDKKYKINGKDKRVTKLLWTPTNALDKKKFRIAAAANFAHFKDADEIRDIETALGYSIMTIHDCYLIDFKNCGLLIEVKQDYYRKKIKSYEINNIFIVV